MGTHRGLFEKEGLDGLFDRLPVDEILMENLREKRPRVLRYELHASEANNGMIQNPDECLISDLLVGAVFVLTCRYIFREQTEHLGY
jgi:hypothetical protein